MPQLFLTVKSHFNSMKIQADLHPGTGICHIQYVLQTRF